MENLSNVMLIESQRRSLEREVEQARLLAAQLHSEVAQLRVELESTRAVAARLAHLRRAPSDPHATLVPVRPGTGAATRITIWTAPAHAVPTGPDTGAEQVNTEQGG